MDTIGAAMPKGAASAIAGGRGPRQAEGRAHDAGNTPTTDSKLVPVPPLPGRQSRGGRHYFLQRGLRCVRLSEHLDRHHRAPLDGCRRTPRHGSRQGQHDDSSQNYARGGSATVHEPLLCVKGTLNRPHAGCCDCQHALPSPDADASAVCAAVNAMLNRGLERLDGLPVPALSAVQHRRRGIGAATDLTIGNLASKPSARA